MKITGIVITAVSALSLVSALPQTPEEHIRGVLGNFGDELGTTKEAIAKAMGELGLDPNATVEELIEKMKGDFHLDLDAPLGEKAIEKAMEDLGLDPNATVEEVIEKMKGDFRLDLDAPLGEKSIEKAMEDLGLDPNATVEEVIEKMKGDFRLDLDAPLGEKSIEKAMEDLGLDPNATVEEVIEKMKGDFRLDLDATAEKAIEKVMGDLGIDNSVPAETSFLGSEPDVPETQPDDVPETDPVVGEPPLVPDVDDSPVDNGPKMMCPDSIPFKSRGVCNGESCHMSINGGAGLWKANFPCMMGTRCTGPGGGDGACCGMIKDGVHARCPNGDWGAHGPPQFPTSNEAFLFVAPESDETADDVKKRAFIA